MGCFVTDVENKKVARAALHQTQYKMLHVGAAYECVRKHAGSL